MSVYLGSTRAGKVCVEMYVCLNAKLHKQEYILKFWACMYMFTSSNIFCIYLNMLVNDYVLHDVFLFILFTKKTLQDMD